MTSEERQFGFLRIAAAMVKQHELEKVGQVLDQMEPGQLKKMIDEAIERGDSRVMITDKAYIDFGIDKVQSSPTTARGVEE